jgi:hypothetical protein
MANSNSPFSKGGISSLLRGASSTASAIQSYQDQAAAFDYSNSAFSDEAYSTYKNYLEKRITDLNSSGTVSDLSKALTMTSTLRAATRSNTSASITRENIQIMAGNASPQDKLNLIGDQFERAVNNGDLTLAQSLESQAYSLSQTIQLDNQQKADAAASLARASSAKATTASATSAANVAKDLNQKLTDFNSAYIHAGQKTLNKVTDDFVKSITPQLNELGIHLAPGVKPNYFDIVQGVNQAMFNAYTNEATIWNGVDDAEAQAAVDKAVALQSNIKTAFGNMSIQELNQAQANPGAYHLKADPEFAGNGNQGAGGAQNPQIGYKFDPKVGVVPTFAANPWIDVPTSANRQIQDLKLQVVGGKGGTNGVQVAPTAQSPDFIKKAIPANTTTHLVYGPLGVQFEGDSASAPGKAVYTLVKDPQGKQAVYESSVYGDKLLGSEQNYNPYPDLPNGMGRSLAHSNGSLSGNSNVAGPTFGNFTNLKGGGTTGLINAADQKQAQIAASNAAAAAAMLAARPQPLPNISIAAPAPPPSIAIAKPPAQHIVIPTYPNTAIAPKTVNPQPAGGVQQAGGINLQGGGGIRLQ